MKSYVWNVLKVICFDYAIMKYAYFLYVSANSRY